MANYLLQRVDVEYQHSLQSNFFKVHIYHLTRFFVYCKHKVEYKRHTSERFMNTGEDTFSVFPQIIIPWVSW